MRGSNGIREEESCGSYRVSATGQLTAAAAAATATCTDLLAVSSNLRKQHHHPRPSAVVDVVVVIVYGFIDWLAVDGVCPVAL